MNKPAQFPRFSIIKQSHFVVSSHKILIDFLFFIPLLCVFSILNNSCGAFVDTLLFTVTVLRLKVKQT